MHPKISRLFIVAPLALTLTQCVQQPNASATGASFQRENVRKITTYDTPGRCSEVISYSAPTGLLLTTNSVSKDISVLSIPDLSSGKFTPIDINLNKSGIQGINTNGEPTSVAVHPSRNIAFAAVNGSSGRLVAFDLNAAKAGKTKFILDQEIGIHLDSIAISPNGKWAVIADEAEGSSSTPGAITLVDISKLGTSDRLPVYKVPGLAAALGRPAGRVEPEFVCIDSRSRFAAIACQDDNAVVIIPLGSNPRVLSVIKLPNGALPDGVNLINYGNSMLLSIAEEGTDSVSIYTVNPKQLNQAPQLITRINVRVLSGNSGRCDPEGVYMFRQAGKLYLAVAIERADRTLIMDITNPAKPRKIAAVPVGSRPEGIIVQKQGGKTYVLTGDEGKPGKGEVSIIEIR
ncbi:MAG: DNA-binding beta-propeller fold protein YncE [Cryomorphaceae bacterium]|jgi:DNA-binding beta-propeller fold protein YncE